MIQVIHVYAIEKDGEYVHIGATDNPQRRILEHRRAYSSDVTMRTLILTDVPEESHRYEVELHRIGKRRGWPLQSRAGGFQPGDASPMRDPEVVARVAEANRGNQNALGHTCPEETKWRMRENNPMHDPEIAARVGAQNAERMRGVPHSAETKQRISKAHLGVPRLNIRGIKHPHAKPIQFGNVRYGAISVAVRATDHCYNYIKRHGVLFNPDVLDVLEPGWRERLVN